MQRLIDSFDHAIRRVRELGSLYHAIRNLTSTVVDPSDILRSQVVLAISALDHLVHELTVNGMLEVYDKKRESTPAFQKFQIPIKSFSGATSPHLSRTAFEAAIRQKHGYLSFQRSEKIADAIRLFSKVALWDTVATVMGLEVRQLRDRINLAVDRRNQIAHEADTDPSYPGARWPIDEQDVKQVTDFVESLGHAICRSVI